MLRLGRRQSGETIIEVMLSVVIIGFTIVTIFVIARNSLDTGQAASERTQVQAMVETQLERMKHLAATQESSAIFESRGDDEFCVTPDLEVVEVGADPVDACLDDSFPSNSGLRIAVRYDSEGPTSSQFDDNTFTVSATWTRVNDTSQERLVKSYRLHDQQLPTIRLSCGEPGNFNLGQYVESNFTDTDDWNNFDVVFSTNIAGNGAPSFVDSSTAIDLLIDPSANIFINTGCEYNADHRTYCRTPNFSQSGTIQNPPDVNDCLFQGNATQSNESAVVVLYDSATSNDPQSASCNGNPLAYFQTAGNPSPPPATPLASWDGSSRLFNIQDGTVRCVELIHVCRATEYAAVKGFSLDPSVVPPDRNPCVFFSSVHFQSVDWRER